MTLEQRFDIMEKAICMLIYVNRTQFGHLIYQIGDPVTIALWQQVEKTFGETLDKAKPKHPWDGPNEDVLKID